MIFMNVSLVLNKTYFSLQNLLMPILKLNCQEDFVSAQLRAQNLKDKSEFFAGKFSSQTRN